MRVPRRLQQVLAALTLVALLAIAVQQGHPLVVALRRIRHADPGLAALSGLAEAVSLYAYALLVRQLLGRASLAVGVRPLLKMTIAGIAMGASLPAGAAASAVYWFRELRHEGAQPGLAALAMLESMVAGIASLASLGILGVAIAGTSGPLASARIPIVLGFVAVLVAGYLFRVRLVDGFRHVMRRFGAAKADHLRRIQRGYAVAAVAHANWLFDCASLYLALRAVHATVPLRGLLVIYAFSQIVAAVPLLPGGGGTVEASLTVGFAAFGHTSGSVIAGVLLYRFFAAWGLVPLGWTLVVASSLRRRGSHAVVHIDQVQDGVAVERPRAA
jgi:putative heme transporter